MKKISFILSLFLFTLTVNAQQTEDDVFVGKSKTYGNYKGTDIGNTKPFKGQINITGKVVKVEWCEKDCMTIWVKKDDGTIVTVGTKDNAFTVPKSIVGKRIIIEGIEPSKLISEKTTLKKEYQKDIQIAATGVSVYNK